jgi:peptidoglycan/xylan/chitin deacetylase (PgdA/CDA1 family)
MYHLVSPQAPKAFVKYTVHPVDFSRQMSLLDRLGYHTVSLDHLRDASARKSMLPSRPIAITFDDGFRDCLRHAAPVMARLGMRATMFVVAGRMGGRSGWMASDGVDLPLLTGTEVLELEQAGVKCESHALTHTRLSTLGTAELSEELARSRDVLEQHLGHAVRHLAYPFGDFDDRVCAVAADCGYHRAYTTVSGKAVPHDDPHRVPRVHIDGRERFADFVIRLATSKNAATSVRRAVTGHRTAIGR